MMRTQRRMTMAILEVKELTKCYPAFKLDRVSFALEEGKITGFIGRNGAGKSTTLNCLFDFVHPDAGEVRFFGAEYGTHEDEIKQRVGFVSSGINYYQNKKLKTISAVTSSFYSAWDGAAYEKYMRMFALDEEKTPAKLSAGMKVKYALTLALSHNAELLILDEPTSGLDPVSRDDLLDVLLGLCDEGKTVFFSTHITSDLDKCADDIIYIKGGRIIADSDMRAFENAYKIAHFESVNAACEALPDALGIKRAKDGCTALIKSEDAQRLGLETERATLESIMVHIEKESETA